MGPSESGGHRKKTSNLLFSYNSDIFDYRGIPSFDSGGRGGVLVHVPSLFFKPPLSHPYLAISSSTGLHGNFKTCFYLDLDTAVFFLSYSTC